MDVRVIEHVNLVQKSLGGDGEIHVISGYRSPTYNALLVKKSRRAVRQSCMSKGRRSIYLFPESILERFDEPRSSCSMGALGIIRGRSLSILIAVPSDIGSLS
jgi:hypothetical protein